MKALAKKWPKIDCPSGSDQSVVSPGEQAARTVSLGSRGRPGSSSLFSSLAIRSATPSDVPPSSSGLGAPDMMSRTSSLFRAGDRPRAVRMSRNESSVLGAWGSESAATIWTAAVAIDHGAGREVDDHRLIGATSLQLRQPVDHDLAGEFLSTSLPGDVGGEQLRLPDHPTVGLDPREGRDVRPLVSADQEGQEFRPGAAGEDPLDDDPDRDPRGGQEQPGEDGGSRPLGRGDPCT